MSIWRAKNDCLKVDKPAAPEDCAEDGSEEYNALLKEDESIIAVEAEAAVPRWHGVGSRLIKAMTADGCFDDDVDVDAYSPAQGIDEGKTGAESDIAVPAWHGVGSRLVAALTRDGCFEDDEFLDVSLVAVPGPSCQDWYETASNAPTESTDEGDSDVGPKVVVSDWHGVGSRLVKALTQDGCFQEDTDTDAWMALGSRVAGALNDNHDEEGVDADAWRDVGGRFATAFKISSDNDC